MRKLEIASLVREHLATNSKLRPRVENKMRLAESLTINLPGPLFLFFKHLKKSLLEFNPPHLVYKVARLRILLFVKGLLTTKLGMFFS